MVNVQVAKTEIVDLLEDQWIHTNKVKSGSLSNIRSLTRIILNHIVHYPHACSDTSVCENYGNNTASVSRKQMGSVCFHRRICQLCIQRQRKGDSIEKLERPAFVDSIATGMSTTNSWMNSKSLYVIYMDTPCCAALMLYEQQRRRWSAGYLEKLIYANDNHAVTLG